MDFSKIQITTQKWFQFKFEFIKVVLHFFELISTQMPRPKYTCPQCKQNVPLYSAHKKCDKQISLFDRVFSYTQNRWNWQCKACLKVDRDYKKHNCSSNKQNQNDHDFFDKKGEAMTMLSHNENLDGNIVIHSNRQSTENGQSRKLVAIDEVDQDNDGIEVSSEDSGIVFMLPSVKGENINQQISEFSGEENEFFFEKESDMVPERFGEPVELEQE